MLQVCFATVYISEKKGGKKERIVNSKFIDFIFSTREEKRGSCSIKSKRCVKSRGGNKKKD